MARKTFVITLTFIAVLGIAIAVGCEKKTTIKGSPGEGIHVDAPGVNVNIGGGKGVQVDAPNVNVDVGGGKGVQVETPKADVNVGGEKK